MPYLSRDVVSSDTDDDTPLLVPLKYVPTADRERLERSLSSTTLYFGDCSRCSKRTALNQLSFKTRFSHLVRGYIRNQNENVPQDVTSLCMRYIGGPRMLNVSNLMTLDESLENSRRHRRRKTLTKSFFQLPSATSPEA